MQKGRDVSNPGRQLYFITVAGTLTYLLFPWAFFTLIKQTEHFFFFKRHPYHFNLREVREVSYRWWVGKEGAPGEGEGSRWRKAGEAAITSFNSLCFRWLTLTNVIELQHWKIFTPGRFVTCKTNVKWRAISQLFYGAKKKKKKSLEPPGESVFFFIRGQN